MFISYFEHYYKRIKMRFPTNSHILNLFQVIRLKVNYDKSTNLGIRNKSILLGSFVCIGLAAFFVASLILIPSDVFAQKGASNGTQVPSLASNSSAGANSSVNQQGNGSQPPVLEKISDKGIYKVQLRWAQFPNLSSAGIDVQIVFLNASAPSTQNSNIPIKETNQSAASSPGATGYTDPSVLAALMPVESYDMTVYSDKGQELWKVTDKPVNAGSAFEKITLNNYTGGITIQLTNIKPLETGVVPGGNLNSNTSGPGGGGNATSNTGNSPASDSVTFTTQVVPESPL